MSYAVMRIETIHTMSQFINRCGHNARQEEYTLGKNHIDKSSSADNIILRGPGDRNLDSIMENFYKIMKDYKEQFELDNSKVRPCRRYKSFEDMLDSKKNAIGIEVLFSSDKQFMNIMSNEELKHWGEKNIEFARKFLKMKEENCLSAVIHKDEEGAYHMHLIFIPLEEKYDGRKKRNVIQTAKSTFWNEKEKGSEFQTEYTRLMNEAGYRLSRGVVNSDRYHLTPEEYKKACDLQARYQYIVKNLEDEVKEELREQLAPEIEEQERQSFIEFNYFDNEFIESCEKEAKAEIINKAIKKLDSAEKINKELQQRNEVLENENKGLKWYQRAYESIIKKIAKIFRRNEKSNEEYKNNDIYEIIGNDNLVREDVKEQINKLDEKDREMDDYGPELW